MFIVRIEHDDYSDDYILIKEKENHPDIDEIKEKLVEFMKDEEDMSYSIYSLVEWLKNEYHCNPYWFDNEDTETIYDSEIYDELEGNEN